MKERTCERCLSRFYGDGRFCDDCKGRMEEIEHLKKRSRRDETILTLTIILTLVSISYILSLDDPKGFVMGWVVTFSFLDIVQAGGLIYLFLRRSRIMEV